jgi:fructose-1,6-bisphosphatase/inositol monophosphatase family enzyme
MEKEIKILAQQVVKKMDRRIRRDLSKNFYKLGKTIGLGADGTPTKYLDKSAEDVAIKTIKQASNPVNILSEEIGFIDNSSDYTFVLDPVDGTRNAYRGIPFFSVSLAIGSTFLNDIWYGIVKNIPTGHLYIAEKEKGAYLNNQQICLPNVPGSDYIFSLSLGKNIEALTEKASHHHVIRTMGSASLEMCLVAQGAIDSYVVGKEFLRVTDIAASTLIVREAGGIVVDKYGKQLDMPLTLDTRTSVIAAGNVSLISNILGS